MLTSGLLYTDSKQAEVDPVRCMMRNITGVVSGKLKSDASLSDPLTEALRGLDLRTSLRTPPVLAL